MRLIAWLLAFANIGGFGWYGFFAPPTANAHYIPSLPTEIEALVLLSEATPTLVARKDEPLFAEDATDEDVAELAVASEEAVEDTTIELREAATAPTSTDDSGETTAVMAENLSPAADDAEVVAEDATPPIAPPLRQAALQSAATDSAESSAAMSTATADTAAAAKASAVTAPPAVVTATDNADTPTTASTVIHATTASTQFSATAANSPADQADSSTLQNLAISRLSSLSHNVPTDFIVAAVTPATLPAPGKKSAPARPAATDTSVCLQAGPYSNKKIAQHVLIQVKAATPRAIIAPKSVQQPGATWVYLQPYPTRADAEFVATMLTRANVIDHYIVGNQPQGFRNAISLGLYRNSSVAQARIAELQGKGYYNVRQQPRYEQKTEYWLELSVDAKQSRAWLAQPGIFQHAQVSMVECKQIAINQ